MCHYVPVIDDYLIDGDAQFTLYLGMLTGRKLNPWFEDKLFIIQL